MAEDDEFKENIKRSFLKVKEDITALKQEIFALKELIIKNKEQIKEEEDKIDQNKPFFVSPLEIMGSGNNGQQRTTDNNRQYQTMPDTLKKDLTIMFKRLTDREFTIFMAIYQLEEELSREVQFTDLSLRLNITESRIRTVINDLIRKGLPIEKKRFLHGKVSLSIKKDFRDLNLATKLLRLKDHSTGQKTLFDL